MHTPGVPGAPARPDESPAQRRVERRWLPLLGVLGVIVFVTLGARGIGAVSLTSPPVGFDGIVRISPEPGWTEEAHSDNGGTHELIMTKGAVALYVAAVEGSPLTAVDVAVEYARSLSDELSEFVPGKPEAITMASGMSAVRFGYVGVTRDGVSVDGIVTATVTDQAVALVFEARAPHGDLVWAADDLGRMIGGAEVL